MKQSTKLTIKMTLIVMAMMFVSCAQSERLTEPNNEDYKVVSSNYYEVEYLINGKVKSMKNRDHVAYKAGDFLVKKPEFRYIGGMYP